MQKQFDALVIKMLDEKIPYSIALCPRCDGYSTKSHAGVYCLSCGTRMKGYPNITWRIALERTWSKGSGVSNSFYTHSSNRFGMTMRELLKLGLKWNLSELIYPPPKG